MLIILTLSPIGSIELHIPASPRKTGDADLAMSLDAYSLRIQLAHLRQKQHIIAPMLAIVLFYIQLQPMLGVLTVQLLRALGEKHPPNLIWVMPAKGSAVKPLFACSPSPASAHKNML